MAELRPGVVFPLSLLSCRSGEGGPSCTATGVRCPFLGSPPGVFIPYLHCHQPAGGRCPQAGPAHSLPLVSRMALTLLLQTHKMYFSLKLHLYICLFFVFKTCFPDKFINILAGALSRVNLYLRHTCPCCLPDCIRVSARAAPM